MIMFTSIISAQELDVRFGDATGGNVAVDGIFSSGSYSRIHGDVSFGNGVGIDLLWNFIYKPLGEEALNWYAGVGAFTFPGTPFRLGVVGEPGLEYRFQIPISVSADWRPAFRLVENTDFHAGGFGLIIRYIF